jgi:arylsulfatase A-like enzyme
MILKPRAEIRRRWMFAVIALAVAAQRMAAVSPVGDASASPRPNIVLILADDLGYGDLGCYGCPDIKTPNIDRLAREGVRLTSYYANGPECTPTRTALLTGRYPHRVGGLECAIGLGNVGRYDDAIRLAHAHDLGLPVADSVLARQLRAAGYATGISGKWHLGYEPKFLPNAHGFDYSFGPLGGATDYFFHTEPGGEPMLFEDGRPVRREGYLTDLITDVGVAFLRRVKDKPFFLYLPYNAPHSPFQGPNDRPDRPVSVAESGRGSRDKYRSLVERLDDGVGKILSELDRTGLAGRTLVIFASDNGGPQHARNDPYSGRKGGLFEGGIRVPCIVRWSGVLPAGLESDRPAMTVDLTASLLRAAGASPLKDRPLDGIDILQDVEKQRPASPRTMFWRARRGVETWRAVRDGTLKYVSRHNGDRVQEHLFDLARDPAEKENLLTRRPDDVARLKRLLVAWEQEVRPAR